MPKIRSIWSNITYNGPIVDKQVEIDAHYLGYLDRQSNDIKSFKKDEAVTIPKNINYDSLSGLSNIAIPFLVFHWSSKCNSFARTIASSLLFVPRDLT